MNKQFVELRERAWQRGNDRGSLCLRHCFLQHKCCIITTSAAETDSHKCEMRQPEKENRTSCLQTTADTLYSLAAIFFSLFMWAHALMCKIYAAFTADSLLSSSDSEWECHHCSSNANRVWWSAAVIFQLASPILIPIWRRACVCVQLNKCICPIA